MAAAKAQPYTECFRKLSCFAGINILRIQEQKDTVIPRRFALLQVLYRNAEPDFAEKDHSFGIGLIQLSDRRFHIGEAGNFQRIVYPHNAAGRKPEERNRVQRRCLRIRLPVQPAVDLLLNTLQLLLFFQNRLFLLPELFLDPVDVPVFEKVLNFR